MVDLVAGGALSAQPAAPLAPQAAPPAAPSPGGFDAAALLSKSDASTQQMLKREQTEMQPSIDRVNQLTAAPRPQPPQLGAQPKPPDMGKDFAKQANEFALAATLMAGIAGGISRRHVTTALNAFGSAMKGLKEGQLQVFNQATREFESASAAAINDNNAKLAEYKAVLDDRKASVDEQMNRVSVIASKYQDNLAYQAASSKNILMLGRAMDQMQLAGDRLALQRQGLIEKKDEFGQKIKMDAAKFGIEVTESGLKMPGGTPEERQSIAAQAATGQPLTQVVPGYGTMAVNARRQAREGAIEVIRNDNAGMSAAEAGVELAKRNVQFQAGTRSVVQLTTMLGGIRQATSQLEFNVAQAKQEMAKLKSTDISPVLNAIARGVEKWTGDPAYSGLFFYLNATAVESARILSGGTASVAQLHAGAQEEAKQWSNINMTPAMFDEVSKAMLAEGGQRIKDYQMAISAQSPGGAPNPGGKPPTGGAAAEEGNDGWSVVH